jgi:predicted benzoate:H+ symporter BenE
MLTKTKIAVVAALILGAASAAMAGGQDSQQSNANATGPNPFMPEFSTPASSGYSAYGRYPVQHHVVHRHVEK